MHPGGNYFSIATEVALLQDGPGTDLGQSSPVRIGRFSSKRARHVADFVYIVGPVVAAPEPVDAFRINGLVELLALSDSSYLALERSFSMGVGNSIRLFLVSTEAADNVRRIKSLEGRTGMTPASKCLLIDLADLDLYLDNVEGMTLGPPLSDGRRSLILVSDDNFSSEQTTQIFAFALSDRELRRRSRRRPSLAFGRGVAQRSTRCRDRRRPPGEKKGLLDSGFQGRR